MALSIHSLKKNDTQSFTEKKRFSGLTGWIDKTFVYRDETEYLERSDVSLAEKFRIVETLTNLNARSGYNALFLYHLEALIQSLSGSLSRNRPINILDTGVGGGGMLETIYNWAMKKEIPVALHGIDISNDFVERAQTRLLQRNIPAKIWSSTACKVKMPNDSFDIVISSYMVHHIRGMGKVALFLSEVYRLAKYGWLIADFDRRLLSPLFAKTAGFLFGARGPLLSDGVKSARRAYSSYEINQIIQGIKSVQDIGAMKCRKFPIAPYWYIRGSKFSSND